MTASLHPAVKAVIAVVSVPLGTYCLFLALGMTPFFQKHFIYAHKIHTLYWSNINNPQKWGFARPCYLFTLTDVALSSHIEYVGNQVTPFSLKTSDGETLYAWHVMPLPLYLQNEAAVEAQAPGFCQDFTKTESFRLLKDDPESRLVLYFHGNAGHVAQGWRPGSYHCLTDTSSYHVVAIDYRGFGHSTGTPTEAGLIQDASTIVDWAIDVAGIPASRIVLLGQSLGTAVVSGVAEKYVLQGVEFAGITIVAGFSDLVSLLTGYRIGGIFPVLAPFRAWPQLLALFNSFIVEKWHSADRLANIVRHTKTRLRINLIHARNDGDIPYTEDDKLFRAAVNEAVGTLNDDEFHAWKEQRTIRKGKDAFVTTWTSEPNIVIRQELFPHGGHNDITGHHHSYTGSSMLSLTQKVMLVFPELRSSLLSQTTSMDVTIIARTSCDATRAMLGFTCYEEGQRIPSDDACSPSSSSSSSSFAAAGLTPTPPDGGACVAMVGKDCVAIACDLRLGVQAMTVSNNFPKIFQYGDVFLGLTGLATDVNTVSDVFRYKTNMYRLREERAIAPRTFANLVSSSLYEKRFGPYFVSPVVAGLDPKTGKPFICGFDSIGCIDFAKDFIVSGTASEQLFGMCEGLWEADMVRYALSPAVCWEPDALFETISQSLLNAVDRDALSGWGAHVYIIEKDKVTKRLLKGRQD
ncbi:hypothetical protein G7046_g4475 [Stylonectria norvegica]|nr:hypothetical protein G7046_g4475 [Stylonectria norvegica]